jgi:hypothetical protein
MRATVVSEHIENVRGRVRSPPYPFITLEAAVRRAYLLERAGVVEAITLGAAAKAWGLAEKSSAVAQTLAALLQYGLVIEEIGRNERQFSLTQRARRILDADAADATRREEAVRQAALHPAAFRELWEFYQRDRSGKPDAIAFLTNLRKERGSAPFSQKAAHDIIRLYHDTWRYAFYRDGTQSARSWGEIQREARAFIETSPSEVATTDLDWQEERLIDNDGEPILIRYRGKPSRERYEFVRDYLDLKIGRMTREDRRKLASE